MEQDKKYTAREVAVAVLKKAEEMLKKSELMKKAETPKQQDVTPSDNVQKDPAPEDHQSNGNPAPGAVPQNHTAPYKGHIKLAKFIGHIESKRKRKAVPNG